MLEEIPLVVWQYAGLGVGVFVAVMAFLWLYNRREKRRRHALQLARLMSKWGMDWFGEAYEMYAIGDYSGLTHKVKEIIQAVRSDAAMVEKLADVARNVAAYYAKNDPAKAAELLEILGVEVEPGDE